MKIEDWISKLPSQSREVKCDVWEDDGGGTTAQCERCGHITESYGTSEASVKRCLVLMREECPEGQLNWYTSDED